MAGATFSVQASDIRELAMGQLLLAVATVGLDLGKEADRAAFLTLYAKQRKDHPELANLVITCKQFPMP